MECDVPNSFNPVVVDLSFVVTANLIFPSLLAVQDAFPAFSGDVIFAEFQYFYLFTFLPGDGRGHAYLSHDYTQTLFS